MCQLLLLSYSQLNIYYNTIKKLQFEYFEWPLIEKDALRGRWCSYSIHLIITFNLRALFYFHLYNCITHVNKNKNPAKDEETKECCRCALDHIHHRLTHKLSANKNEGCNLLYIKGHTLYFTSTQTNILSLQFPKMCCCAPETDRQLTIYKVKFKESLLSWYQSEGSEHSGEEQIKQFRYDLKIRLFKHKRWRHCKIIKKTDCNQ